MVLGKPFKYWNELQREMDGKGLDAQRWFEELVELRGKVAFYESRIKEMMRLIDA